MTTLRDALTSAFDAAASSEPEQAASLEAVAVSEAPSEPKPERVRDESGRFSKTEAKAEAKEEISEPAQQDQQVSETKPARKAPSSWKKDYWGSWEKLGSDPELAKLQDYIEQRESEFTTGVSTYRNEAMKAKAIQDAIAPYVPIMQQYGIAPETQVKNLMAAHHGLLTASPEQRLQMFARLATDYGVPLQALTGGQQAFDPQMGQMMQELSTLRNQFGQMRQANERAQQDAVAAQIADFSKSAPHFERVRETMGGLLQAGLADSLKTAYDKAIRMHDDVWSEIQAQQAKEAEKARQAEIAKKRATAVSTKSSAPTAAASGGKGGNGLRATLMSAFDEHQNRI